MAVSKALRLFDGFILLADLFDFRIEFGKIFFLPVFSIVVNGQSFANICDNGFLCPNVTVYILSVREVIAVLCLNVI